MNISVETKFEFNDTIEDVINGYINTEIDNDNKYFLIENNENEGADIIESDITDEILNIDNSIETKHLTFTNIINNQKIQINRKKYISWLNDNYELLQSAFYIVSKKYLNNNNVKINFKEFVEFCFLYY